MDRTKTILVADDDEDFVAQVRLRLEAAGYRVVTAQGERKAEEVLKDLRPDLALVDLMMGTMDAGFVLCHHIKKKYPGVPVLIVTAVTSETGLEFDAATDEERLWVKADAMLAKPVRLEQLEAQVARLLKGTESGNTEGAGHGR
jgi:CheY-like chemotaxis protein